MLNIGAGFISGGFPGGETCVPVAFAGAPFPVVLLRVELCADGTAFEYPQCVVSDDASLIATASYGTSTPAICQSFDGCGCQELFVSGSGGLSSDCCRAVPQEAGCGGACEACVCGERNACCSGSWDAECAVLAHRECVEVCGCGAPLPASDALIKCTLPVRDDVEPGDYPASIDASASGATYPTPAATAYATVSIPIRQRAGDPCESDADCQAGPCRDDDDPSTLQRVCCAEPCAPGGVCGAGTGESDGNGTCFLPAGVAIDTAGDVGSHNAIAVGADGLGIIAYYASTAQELRVAHCDDAACSLVTKTTIEQIGAIVADEAACMLDIAIGADGYALISYYDKLDEDLRVVDCKNAACTSFDTYRLDGLTTQVGRQNSIAVDGAGLALISYYADSGLDLKVARCTNQQCSAAVVSTLDSDGNAGLFTSVAIGADGRGLISYRHSPADDLEVAHCDDANCTTATRSTIDDGDVQFTSIVVGPDDRGIISYYDQIGRDLEVAHCDDTNCTSAARSTVDSSVSTVGQASSIAISFGAPIISYYDGTNGDLAVARCFSADCSSSATERVLSSHDIGRRSSIAIGADGNPLISYYDATAGDLRVLHCLNGECAFP